VTRLHVFVGGGGVGKTTLAAGYALALARQGRRVGLLGIDPARRLQSALGLTLPDLEVPVPGAGELRAALLRPADCLRRWAAEATTDPAAAARLQKNAFFLALADRLAAASDILAAVRMAEWLERDPALTDLVVDTAPGLNAVEFLSRPQHLTAFLEGRLVKALRWVARGRPGFFGAIARGGVNVLGGLARIGGTSLLLELADFLLLVEDVMAKMLTRLEAAQRWLHGPDTHLLIVAAVREDTETSVRQLTAALHEVAVPPRAILVNRALPATLEAELAGVDVGALDAEAAAVIRFARGYCALQARVVESVRAFAPLVVVVPAAASPGETTRLETLRWLGEHLLEAESPRPKAAPVELRPGRAVTAAVVAWPLELPGQ
jgi:arsenite-transporting ATPase